MCIKNILERTYPYNISVYKLGGCLNLDKCGKTKCREHRQFKGKNKDLCLSKLQGPRFSHSKSQRWKVLFFHQFLFETLRRHFSCSVKEDPGAGFSSLSMGVQGVGDSCTRQPDVTRTCRRPAARGCRVAGYPSVSKTPLRRCAT